MPQGERSQHRPGDLTLFFSFRRQAGMTIAGFAEIGRSEQGLQSAERKGFAEEGVRVQLVRLRFGNNDFSQWRQAIHEVSSSRVHAIDGYRNNSIAKRPQVGKLTA